MDVLVPSDRVEPMRAALLAAGGVVTRQVPLPSPLRTAASAAWPATIAANAHTRLVCYPDEGFRTIEDWQVASSSAGAPPWRFQLIVDGAEYPPTRVGLVAYALEQLLGIQFDSAVLLIASTSPVPDDTAALRGVLLARVTRLHASWWVHRVVACVLAPTLARPR